MKQITEAQSNAILEELKKRGASGACPRCRGVNFNLEPQYAMVPVQSELVSYTLGGAVPAAVVVCKQCGFISLHALGTLGLMPEAKTAVADKDVKPEAENEPAK